MAAGPRDPVETDSYRNLEPKSMIQETKHLIVAPWDKKTTHGLGSRPDAVQNAFDMDPETLDPDETPIGN